MVICIGVGAERSEKNEEDEGEGNGVVRCRRYKLAN